MLGAAVVMQVHAATAACPVGKDAGANASGKAPCVRSIRPIASNGQRGSNARCICAAVQKELGQPLGIEFVAGALPSGEALPTHLQPEHDRAVGVHFNAVLTAAVSTEQARALRRRLAEATGLTGIRFGNLHVKRARFASAGEDRVNVYLVAHLNSADANRNPASALQHLFRDVAGGTLLQAFANGSLDEACAENL